MTHEYIYQASINSPYELESNHFQSLLMKALRDHFKEVAKMGIIPPDYEVKQLKPSIQENT